jgi:long-chain acyl-CoA synthetase
VNIVDAIRRRAVADAEHPAVLLVGRAGTTRISYAALLEQADRIALALKRGGLRAGARCGMLAPEGPRFVETALGILAAGGCLAPLPTDSTEATIDEFRRSCHIHHLVRAKGELAIERTAERPPLKNGGDQAYERLAPAYLRLTSGTTNVRKGVLLGHQAIEDRLAAANAVLQIGPGDGVLWVLPMAHHFVVSILLYLTAGATVVIPEGSLAEDMLAAAEQGSATLFYGSPYHFKLLAKDVSGRRLDRLRLAISTTAGLTAETAERFFQRFGLPITQALGIIEVGLPVINHRSAHLKPTALGRPLPAYDVWLREEDGTRMRDGGAPTRTGEICIRGPGLFDAYLDPWAPAAAVVEDGSFRTGDQGWFDADGDLHMVGRRHNRINVAGLKFFAEEIESVLERHPKVRQTLVRPIPHHALGEIPVADIVPVDPAQPPTAQELSLFCRGQLPAHKVPRRFSLVTALPTTATGKLQRWSASGPD